MDSIIKYQNLFPKEAKEEVKRILRVIGTDNDRLFINTLEEVYFAYHSVSKVVSLVDGKGNFARLYKGILEDVVTCKCGSSCAVTSFMKNNSHSKCCTETFLSATIPNRS